MNESLERLHRAWLAVVAKPRTRALVALGTLVVIAALLVARVGTPRARIGGAVALASIAVLAVLHRRRERRIADDPERLARRLTGGTDAELTEKIVRALRLAKAPPPGTSVDLAEMFVARTLGRIPDHAVARAARQRRWGFRALFVASFGLGFAGCARDPFAPIEGADVLFARGGRAPMPLAWLESIDVAARPPDYLHQEEHHRFGHGAMSLPRGSLLTVRGTPMHARRRLFLTDGLAEVPFVEDGGGRVVARWPLAESSTLHVAARFGAVVVYEPEEIPVTSIPDETPIVKLEGAPKDVLLGKEDAPTELALRYEATDDHGLREVHLVLRSGAREERRVLAKLDGETRTDRGGHVLRFADPFVKKSHVPVQVTVEAKDNDAVTGPKWGASQAFVLTPPDVGEPESRRLDALRALRDHAVDLLAKTKGGPLPKVDAEKKASVAVELATAEKTEQKLEETLSGSFAGLRVSGRLAAMLRGNMRKVLEAARAQKTSPGKESRDKLAIAEERLVLVVDATVSGQALRDARDAAKALADVADDLAASVTDTKSAAAARTEADVRVLSSGSQWMAKLGSLGLDLGEITDVYLRRVARARGAQDLPHAELAARDLALRLRTPDPSFGSKGGSGGRAGGESGGARGSAGGDHGDGPSDAEQAFMEASQELERLALEHASQMGKVDQAIGAASEAEDTKALREEVKKHAQAIREAVKNLPSVGQGSDSWTSKGAAAREHAEQMARSLEEGRVAEAAESGKNAMSSLDEAKRTAQRDRARGWDPEGEARAESAQKKLDPEVRAVERAMAELRRRAEERARGELGKQGDEEGKIGDRARKLGQRGREDGALPQPALDALDEAARRADQASEALKQGDSKRAQEHQRAAQEKLEQAKSALGQDGDEQEKGDTESTRGGMSGEPTDIPKAEAHKGPEEFRRRVVKGLGQKSDGKQRDAVRRYAEGLLR